MLFESCYFSFRSFCMVVILYTRTKQRWETRTGGLHLLLLTKNVELDYLPRLGSFLRVSVGERDLMVLLFFFSNNVQHSSIFSSIRYRELLDTTNNVLLFSSPNALSLYFSCFILFSQSRCMRYSCTLVCWSSNRCIYTFLAVKY